MSERFDGASDALGSWQYAIACCRADADAGRRLTPQERDAVVSPEYVERLHAGTFRRIGDVAAEVVAKARGAG